MSKQFGDAKQPGLAGVAGLLIGGGLGYVAVGLVGDARQADARERPMQAAPVEKPDLESLTAEIDVLRREVERLRGELGVVSGDGTSSSTAPR